jgi:hypothetical protein
MGQDAELAPQLVSGPSQRPVELIWFLGNYVSRSGSKKMRACPGALKSPLEAPGRFPLEASIAAFLTFLKRVPDMLFGAGKA